MGNAAWILLEIKHVSSTEQLYRNNSRICVGDRCAIVICGAYEIFLAGNVRKRGQFLDFFHVKEMCGKSYLERISPKWNHRNFWPTVDLTDTFPLDFKELRGSRAKEQVILNSSKISTRALSFHCSQVSWMREWGTDAIPQVYRRIIHLTQTLLKAVSDERQDLGK